MNELLWNVCHQTLNTCRYRLNRFRLDCVVKNTCCLCCQVPLTFFSSFFSQMIAAQTDKTTREHLFVIKVEKVSGLTPLQSTVWGEADCYVQYSFPSQEAGPDAQVDQNLIETSKALFVLKRTIYWRISQFIPPLTCVSSPTGVNLKLFRTTTTLCVPDPVFGHTETHVLLAPEGVPVQRLLLGCLSCRGLSGGGGIQFEVWCRFVAVFSKKPTACHTYSSKMV